MPTMLPRKVPREMVRKAPAEAEKSADHWHHLYVAHAHAIALTNEFVNYGGGPEQQAAERGAEKGVE